MQEYQVKYVLVGVVVVPAVAALLLPATLALEAQILLACAGAVIGYIVSFFLPY